MGKYSVLYLYVFDWGQSCQRFFASVGFSKQKMRPLRIEQNVSLLFEEENNGSDSGEMRREHEWPPARNKHNLERTPFLRRNAHTQGIELDKAFSVFLIVGASIIFKRGNFFVE